MLMGENRIILTFCIHRQVYLYYLSIETEDCLEMRLHDVPSEICYDDYFRGGVCRRRTAIHVDVFISKRPWGGRATSGRHWSV